MITDPLNNYPRVYWGIGGAQVIKSADIPDANLCIGEAELQAPVPLVYKIRATNQSMRADIQAIRTQDDLLNINAGAKISNADFTADYWFGEVIE